MRGSRGLTDAEITAALTAARGARNRAFLGALCYLGARISEILHLDLADVCRGGAREAPIFVAEVTIRRATSKGRRRGRVLAITHSSERCSRSTSSASAAWSPARCSWPELAVGTSLRICA